MKQIIIQRPHITEKSLALAQRGVYTFAVLKHATKYEITQAVHALYGVTVTGVKTVSMHGKSHRVGRRSKIVTNPDWKKAIVSVKSGQKIDVFELSGNTKDIQTQEKTDKKI